MHKYIVVPPDTEFSTNYPVIASAYPGCNSKWKIVEYEPISGWINHLYPFDTEKEAIDWINNRVQSQNIPQKQY